MKSVIPHKCYKASGRRWLGDVPQHWEVKRIRFVADLNPSKNEVSALSRDIEVSFIPMEAVGENGSLVLDHVRPIREVEIGYAYFREGDVTVAKITPCFENGKGAIMSGLVGGIGFGTTELTVARPKHSKTTAEYLYWLFTSAHFRKLGEGAMYGAGGQKRVPDDFLRDFVWAFPPLAEQAGIAAFLDRETAKIDALVEEQKRLIELLKEKRQAVISHAVTKGLHPNLPMKDSGVEWLGAVPAHWTIRKFGHVSFMQEGPGLRNWQFTEGGTRVICVTNITEDGIDFSKLEKFISKDEYERTYQHFTVEDGDLLISSSGNSWGKVAIYHGCEKTILNTSTIRVHEARSRSLLNAYLFWLLGSLVVREQLGLAMTGACQPNFGPTHLKEIIVPVPTVSDQEAISAFLDRETRKFDDLIIAADHAVTLLQERRAALISAAVTGKIDVRGLIEAAAPTPDMVAA
jgi:type I restriction enzyme S subunit